MDLPQNRLLLPKLDIRAVDADKEHRQEWEAEEDVKGGTLDRLEDKAARQKEVQYLWDREVRVLHRSGTEDTNGTQPSWPQMDRHQHRYRRSPRYRSRLVCTVRHKGVEPIFSATCPLETLRVRLGVACQEDVFRAEDPFLISTADVSRAHFYADAVRDVYVPRTPRQCSQACVENCERRCTSLWMLPNGGDNIMLRFWRREDFPRRGFSPLFPQRLANLHSGTR